MSVVTDVIVTVSTLEGVEQPSSPDRYPAVEHINAWLAFHRLGSLGKVDDRIGGTKSLQCGIFVGAFRSLPRRAFLEVVKAAPWEDPACVRVFWQHEDDDAFSDASSWTPGCWEPSLQEVDEIERQYKAEHPSRG